ncbi:hypothetical protein [Klebsiella pneumoniae]|uniref:hypothetical protein n=1 Tax=Klebsiella pneumoniae TaxID=573 RepID=UPI001F5E46B2|nr:hypothetical protein [Klebsiella pneumoniae]MCS5955871.1 hypothetical protein [Klebsiella pneumoniae subsp. pneumoniae]
MFNALNVDDLKGSKSLNGVLKLIDLHSFSAQCSPRPACPLKGAHLMQVHDLPRGAPVLALAGVPVSVKRMQNHAPYACMAFLGEKGGIFGNF